MNYRNGEMEIRTREKDKIKTKGNRLKKKILKIKIKREILNKEKG